MKQSLIFAILERFSRLIRALLWEKTKQTGLSPIQIQFLQFLANQPPERRRVGCLSQAFELTTATVSDAISTLEKKGLVKKMPEKKDERVRTLTLTQKGRQFVQALSDWGKPIEKALETLPERSLRETTASLLLVLRELQTQKITQSLRMCFFCQHVVFDEKRKQPAWCNLTHEVLYPHTIKVDCALFEDSFLV